MKAFRSCRWHNIAVKNGRTTHGSSYYCVSNYSEKRRRFTTKSTSNQQSSSCKRIHVWEQTMASYAANSCTSTSDLNPEQEDNIKLRRNGLVLYKPLIIVNQNDNINNINNKRGTIGWEIHTATTSTEQSVYCSGIL